jgi:hypothetical protein
METTISTSVNNISGSLLSRMVTPEAKRLQNAQEQAKFKDQNSEPSNIYATEKIAEDDEYRVDPMSEVVQPPAICKIGNRPTLTTGNFIMINGKAKSGKTFFIGSIVASCLNNSLQLGNIKGCMPEGRRNVLYFDTEQSKFHINRSIKRICTLAGNENPGNLFAYGIRSLSTEERINFIVDKLHSLQDYSLVIVDGVRDLLEDGINDESGATKITELFMQASEKKDCCILLVLHQNKTNDKARGHIGTELINKAETVISVVKDDKTNIFTVSSQESRDVTFDDFSFIIDDGQIKSSVAPPKEKKKDTSPESVSDERHKSVLNEIFESEVSYSYDALMDEVSAKFKIGRNLTRDYVKFYQEQDYVIKKKEGRTSSYSIKVNS